MRRLAALLLVAAAPAAAQMSSAIPGTHRPQWAAGFTLGDPSGVTIKRYLGGRDAFDFGMGFLYSPGVRFSADYLRDFARVITNKDIDLDLYAGLGGLIGVLTSPCGPGFLGNRCNSDVYAGGRVPFGIELLFRRAPFTVGLELAPGIAFAPGRAGFLLDFLLVGRVLM